MAINPIQLVGLQRQTPDFVGEFMRGREFKQNQELNAQKNERQNQILQMEQNQYAQQQQALQQEQQAAQDQKEIDFFGRSADYLTGLDPKDRVEAWEAVKEIGQESGFDIPDQFSQYSDSALKDIRAHATIKGYKGGLSSANVQSAESYPGGITKITTRDGQVFVKDAGNRIIGGEAANKAIMAAEDRKADIAGDVRRTQEEGKLDAQGRLQPNVDKQIALSKDAAKLSTEMFKRMGAVEQNISNLEEGVRLVESGAASGPINKWFPSFKPATIALDNLKNRLGLDVLSQVTFGSLSEKELGLALDTAVPANLRGDDLKAWFQERIEPQKKLLAALEDAGIYLAEEGSTIPKLMARRRQQRNDTQANSDDSAPQGNANPQAVKFLGFE